MNYRLLEFGSKIVCDIVLKRKYKLPSSNQSILPYLYSQTYQNRNNSWKPECVLSFNMGWRILIIFIRQPMLKLKTHSGFHDFFLFIPMYMQIIQYTSEKYYYSSFQIVKTSHVRMEAFVPAQRVDIRVNVLLVSQALFAKVCFPFVTFVFLWSLF